MEQNKHSIEPDIDSREPVIMTLNSTTELPNLAVLEANLSEEIKQGEANIAVLAIDVDDLKTVNDTYGHQAGDEHLRAIASMIGENIRENDGLALAEATASTPPTSSDSDLYHRSGDEFFVILHDVSDSTVAKRVKNRLQEQLDMVRRGISIGVTEYEPGDTVETLLVRADQALSVDKTMRHDARYTRMQKTLLKVTGFILNKAGLTITRVNRKSGIPQH